MWKDEFSEIKSILFYKNTKKTNTLLGEKNILIWEKVYSGSMDGTLFYISPTSFFQINLEQAKKLYSKAISMFSNIENKYIVDAYSGTDYCYDFS